MPQPQILISVNERGIVEVQGNIADPVVGLGLIQAGMTKLQTHFLNQQNELLNKPGIVVAAATDIPPATPFRS